MIHRYFDAPPTCLTPSIEDGSQVIAALEQRDNVYFIELKDPLSSPSLLEKMATTMQETHPALKYVSTFRGR